MCAIINFMNIGDHYFWSQLLNLWTDLFSPFFVLAQKLASQSTRFNDLCNEVNKSSVLYFN